MKFDKILVGSIHPNTEENEKNFHTPVHTTSGHLNQ